MSKNSFIKGAAILGIAGIVTKILGAFYRIPLSNLMGTEGLGHYQTAYPLYTLLLAVSTAGFPTAIAKLISEKRAIEDYRGADRIFKVSFFGFLAVGIVTALFIGIFSEQIVRFIGNENGYYALMGLVPALLLVPIMSAFRGYFQGQQYMIPIAASQMAEQTFRVLSGLPLAYILLERGLPQAAGGATAGGSIGALAGVLLIFIAYIRERKNRLEEHRISKIYEQESIKRIANNILKIAVPITIGSAMAPLINNIDTFLIMRRLQDIGYTTIETSKMLGQLSGNAQTLINFPHVLSTALAMSLVPAVSDAIARKNPEKMRKIVKTGIRMTLLIGLPSAVGLFVLSTPIIKLLYFNNTLQEQIGAGSLLQVLSIGLIFLTLSQSLTAMIQGLGKPFIPVRNMGIGVIGKVILTYILTGIPALNIRGAAIATVFTYGTACILNFIEVKKMSGIKIDKVNTIIKPSVSAAIMGLVAFIAYNLSLGAIGGSLATLVGVGIGVLVYGLLLFLTGTIMESDFLMIPKSDKLLEFLKKMKLIRK